MTTQMTASVVNGMLKPDQTLPLADQTRVKLTIEPIEEWSPEAALAAWEALKAPRSLHLLCSLAHLIIGYPRNPGRKPFFLINSTLWQPSSCAGFETD